MKYTTAPTHSQVSSGLGLATNRDKTAKPSDFDLLRHQNDISVFKGSSICGRTLVPGSAAVISRNSGAKARLSGVAYCRSSTCVYCTKHRQREVQKEWYDLLTAARAKGLQVAFCVFTLRTQAKRSNSNALKVLKGAMGELLRSQWGKPRGIVGFLRSFELVYRIGGKLNPHVNCLLLYDGENLHSLDFQLRERWRSLVKKRDPAHSPSLEWGCHFEVIDNPDSLERVVNYSSKVGLAKDPTKECVLSFNKDKGVGLNPAELLRRSYEGCEISTKLFQAWQRDVKGMRKWCISRGLKNRFAPFLDSRHEEIEGSEDEDTGSVLELRVKLGVPSYTHLRYRKMMSFVLGILSVCSRDKADLFQAIVHCFDYDLMSESEFYIYIRKWAVFDGSFSLSRLAQACPLD